MKKKFKKTIIIGLALTFAYTSFLCCDPSSAQAKETVPECRQAAQDTDTSQSTNNADSCCLDIVSAILEKVHQNLEQIQIATLVIQNFTTTFSLIASNIEFYQAPLQFYDTSPLYIKHATLRI